MPVAYCPHCKPSKKSPNSKFCCSAFKRLNLPLDLYFNGVRRALMQAENDACVTDLASQGEFWHMSQFAKDYRDLFGELLSQTLEAKPAGQQANLMTAQTALISV